MAHNLNFNNQTGNHSFFSVQEKAWHGLGTIVENYPTSKEAIEFAGLNFTVEKRQLFTYDNETQEANPETELRVAEIEVPNYSATVRTDTEQVLGVVGKDYQIIQNIDAFSFFDAIVGGDGIQYETAGALGNGEVIFITAKLPSYIKVGRDDLIEKHLFFTTGHDGLHSATAAFTPTRIVCANTLAAALNNCSNSIKIRHTATAKEKLIQAHTIMGITNRLSDDLSEIFNQWAKIKIEDAEVKKLIQLAMVPNKEVLKKVQEGLEDELSTQFINICDKTFEYTMSAPSQQLDTTKGTLFGVYNGITGYFQNVKQYKNEETKLKSIMLGGIAQLRTQTAFNLCMDRMSLS